MGGRSWRDQDGVPLLRSYNLRLWVRGTGWTQPATRNRAGRRLAAILGLVLLALFFVLGLLCWGV